jgi:hypothetical protein
MFRLRKEHYVALANETRAQFHRRLAAYFRSTLPQRTEKMKEEALLDLIRDGDRRATGFGLVTERGIAQFVALCLLLGPRFDDDPDIHSFLATPGFHPERKTATLLEALADHTVLSAVMRAGGKGWYPEVSL